jgi:hypothetical protein
MAEETSMSEKSGSYVGVMIFAIVLAVLAYFQFRDGNVIEDILAVATVVFCLGLLVKQRWALKGVCLTLLIGVGVYFTQTWLQPIVEDNTSLILPNVIKMVLAILLLLYIGRERIEERF